MPGLDCLCFYQRVRSTYVVWILEGMTTEPNHPIPVLLKHRHPRYSWLLPHSPSRLSLGPSDKAWSDCGGAGGMCV